MLIIQHFIAGLYLISGSISDFKTREVADWSNYGLIVFGIAYNLMFAIMQNNYWFFLNSLIGFGIFFLLAVIMFYSGQWGGGDSKMLMGLGALYGLNFNQTFLLHFIINTLIAGAFYGILWSFFIAIKNRKKFSKEFMKLFNSNRKTRKLLLIVIPLMLIAALIIRGFPGFTIGVLAVGIYSIFYLWLVIKSVENACMYKLVEPDKLTEGDWIAKDVKYQGKVVTGPKDLGISKKSISKVKKLYRENKIKKILIKEGIPFVPSFLLGWLMTILFGNLFLYLL